MVTLGHTKYATISVHGRIYFFDVFKIMYESIMLCKNFGKFQQIIMYFNLKGSYA